MKITHKKTKPIFLENIGCCTMTFTNENIAGYIEQIGTRKKEVLCVAASGDHLIDSALVGAKNITAYDANEHTLYYSELKMVALCTLNRNDFIKFFTHEIGKPLDHDIYLALRPNLTDKAREFWDMTYQKNDYNSKKIESEMFEWSFPKNGKNMNESCRNLYLRLGNYSKAQDQVGKLNVEYLHTIVDNLLQETGGKKFDLALFSNIESFWGGNGWHQKGYNFERFNSFYNDVLKPLLKNVDTTQATYIWNYFEQHKNQRAKYMQYIRQQGYKPNAIQFNSTTWGGMCGDKIKDAIITIQK